MYLYRTPKALLELAPGRRQLSLRERSVLLLAENTPTSTLRSMYHGQGSTLVQRLLDDGYLQPHAIPAHIEPSPGNQHNQTPAATVSLAGVRMHLFELCERMFANRLHDTASHLQQHAGLERAEALRRQLALMLPERSLENGDESAFP
jgi:hypothetical protein